MRVEKQFAPVTVVLETLAEREAFLEILGSFLRVIEKDRIWARGAHSQKSKEVAKSLYDWLK